MRTLYGPSLGLPAVVLLLVAVPLSAAELPQKYLLDDTDGLVTVNVQQIVKSPLFAKDVAKLADQGLNQEIVQNLLKDSGFDPLRDLERITVVFGRSSHAVSEEVGKKGFDQRGPLLLLQGRFDPDKLKAKAEQLLKDFPDRLKSEQEGDATIYSLVTPPGDRPELYITLLDRTTVAASPQKAYLVDALAKAADKKKTQLKYVALEKLLKNLDLKASLGAVAIGDFVVGTSITAMANADPEVKLKTLGDEGIEAVRGQLIVKDEAKGEVTLVCKDADTAKTLFSSLEQSLGPVIEKTTGLADQDMSLAPVVAALKSVKIEYTDEKLTLKAQASGQALVGVVKMWFVVRAGPSPAPQDKDK
jgi:hypothetical protein